MIRLPAQTQAQNRKRPSRLEKSGKFRLIGQSNRRIESHRIDRISRIANDKIFAMPTTKMGTQPHASSVYFALTGFEGIALHCAAAARHLHFCIAIRVSWFVAAAAASGRAMASLDPLWV